jgi:hypothetical protein
MFTCEHFQVSKALHPGTVQSVLQHAHLHLLCIAWDDQFSGLILHPLWYITLRLQLRRPGHERLFVAGLHGVLVPGCRSDCADRVGHVLLDRIQPYLHLGLVGVLFPAHIGLLPGLAI